MIVFFPQALHLLTNDDSAATIAIIPYKKKNKKSFVSRSISRWASQDLHLLTNDDNVATVAIIPEKKKKKKSSLSRSISRWASQSTLGSGACASVSLAIDLDDGLMFAVKSTSAATMYSYRKSPELRAMESEISILRSLNCAQVISYLGDDTSYDINGHALSRNLFLEYMEGGSVHDLMKRRDGPLHEEQVL